MTEPELITKVTDSVVALIEEKKKKSIGSTYRIQFHKDFTFQQATEIIPYLYGLGITHIYASPILKAKPNSPHGYDVCDFGVLNPELGTEEDFRSFIDKLHVHEMGMILDFVPNHMSATTHNEWWNDVLENGPNSPYSNYFDIDWHPVKTELDNKILLPVLEQQYGNILEAGQLQLRHHEGRFVLAYFDNTFPIGPKTMIPILTTNIEQLRDALANNLEQFEEFQSIITALEQLPPQTATESEKVAERHREKEVIRRRIKRLESECKVVMEHIQRNINDFNGDASDPKSFDRLDEILSRQAYRLCHWKTASDEINYRRFFDVNELTAVCMEQQEVFDAAHKKLIELLANGDIDGVRIDHIDGLYDPVEYLWRLQRAYVSELGRREFGRLNAEIPAADKEPQAEPASTWSDFRPRFLSEIANRLELPGLSDLVGISNQASMAKRAPCVQANLPLYVLVEKILGPDEPLPVEWPVAGTTGYEFLNLVNGLLLDTAGLGEINKIYGRFIDSDIPFSEVVLNCKFLILRVAMSSELQMLAHRLNRISEQHRRSRDFTLNTLRNALQEILAFFPVYRAYPEPNALPDRDRRFIYTAIAKARRKNPSIDGSVFDFIRQVLLLEHPEGISPESQRERELFTGRFQQVTSPLMAKGMEDTAFYVHFPLASINEVGAHAATPVSTISNFHKENQSRQKLWPMSMLSLSTHDTKRSEDMRARLQSLSEVPQDWRESLQRWSRLNRRFVREVDGSPAPSRNDEYLFYQTIAGIWPTTPPTESELDSIIARCREYMLKAIHEAKLSTSWINPNTAYDQAVADFVTNSLSMRRDNRFMASLQQFVDDIAAFGIYNSLSQTLLKFCSPGVPDTYQGQEFFDFSLVDPDNRRPVDYLHRQRKHEQIAAKSAANSFSSGGEISSLSAAASELKLRVTLGSLQARKNFSKLFSCGEYIPFEITGENAEHVCAFARKWNDGNETTMCIVAVPLRLRKLVAKKAISHDRLFSSEVWDSTTIQLPEDFLGHFAHSFTGEKLQINDKELSVSKLLSNFPVALLMSCSN